MVFASETFNVIKKQIKMGDMDMQHAFGAVCVLACAFQVRKSRGNLSHWKFIVKRVSKLFKEVVKCVDDI